MGFFASLLGFRDEQERGNSYDAALAELQRRDYAPGGRLYEAVAASDPAQADANWQAVQRNLRSSATGNIETQLVSAAALAPLEWTYDPAQAWQDTQQGAGIVTEGAAELLPKVGGWIGSLGNSLLKAIPWWAWLGLGLFLAWKLGLIELVKRRIARA